MSGYKDVTVTLKRPGFADVRLLMDILTDVPVTDPELKAEVVDAFGRHLALALDPARYLLTKGGSLSQPTFTPTLA